MHGERQKRYGNGRWPRAQLYAIVASYREIGRSAEWVAARLHVGPAMVREIYDYLAWHEEMAALLEAERRQDLAAGDPL